MKRSISKSALSLDGMGPEHPEHQRVASNSRRTSMAANHHEDHGPPMHRVSVIEEGTAGQNETAEDGAEADKE